MTDDEYTRRIAALDTEYQLRLANGEDARTLGREMAARRKALEDERA